MFVERNLMAGIRPFITSKEAIVVTGMRRVGKTSLLKMIYDGLPGKNKLFLDMENPINQKYFAGANFEMVASNLKFLGLDLSKKSYLFLDEIQLVKNLPRVVKYLIDTYKIKFFVTGSVSFYLKNFFTETLAGRKFLFELYPLSFDEFVRFKNSRLQIPAAVNEEIHETLNTLFAEYLEYGGFPDVALRDSAQEKKKYLEDIFTSYYQMDIVRLGDFRKNKVVQDLVMLLLERTGSKLDISKLASELGISRITLNEYISFLEGSYFIHLIRPFSRNKDTEITKMPKVYMCDTGIINHLTRVSRQKLFENCAYSQLKQLGEVNYYQKKTGPGIDFILNKKTAINARASATKQELGKLIETAKAINISNCYIASMNFCSDAAIRKHALYGYNITTLR